MKLEYDYTIGPDGIRFSLIEGFDDDIDFEGSAEDRMTIQKYIMLAWQDAINKTSKNPEEIRTLMASEDGRKRLTERASEYLSTLLENIPPELDRRRGGERRNQTRSGTGDRRRLGRRARTA